MNHSLNRRRFLKLASASAAAPFLFGLPGLRSAIAGADPIPPKRLVIVFSPNGTVPEAFWPDGDQLGVTPILEPLTDFHKRLLLIKGLSNRLDGPGDNHTRGIGCLLTGSELLPPSGVNNGSTAGWSSGASVDQLLKAKLQGNPATATRFGSLEFGVFAANHATPSTRMCYAGPNQPLTPINNPALMFKKLYGQIGDTASVTRMVDHSKEALNRIIPQLDANDRALLEAHLTLVREMEAELLNPPQQQDHTYSAPTLPSHIEVGNDTVPQVSRLQIDLLVNALANDISPIATLQYSHSFGQTRMGWLGIEEAHHTLSHEPDGNSEAKEKLTRINRWFGGELAYLLKKLEETKEPSTDDGMLDHTLVIWVNELGKGNNHSLDDLPILLAGGEKATGFRMGRLLMLADQTPHNRLWLSILEAFGHPQAYFGRQDLSGNGPLAI